MTLALENMGSQAPGDNWFCGLPGRAGLHSLLEHSSLQVLSCTRNKVPVAKRRGKSAFLVVFFLQTQRDPQAGGAVCHCLLSLRHSPAPSLGLSPRPPSPFALSPPGRWRRLGVSGLVLPCLKHGNTSLLHPNSL